MGVPTQVSGRFMLMPEVTCPVCTLAGRRTDNVRSTINICRKEIDIEVFSTGTMLVSDCQRTQRKPHDPGGVIKFFCLALECNWSPSESDIDENLLEAVVRLADRVHADVHAQMTSVAGLIGGLIIATSQAVDSTGSLSRPAITAGGD